MLKPEFHTPKEEWKSVKITPIKDCILNSMFRRGFSIQYLASFFHVVNRTIRYHVDPEWKRIELERLKIREIGRYETRKKSHLQYAKDKYKNDYKWRKYKYLNTKYIKIEKITNHNEKKIIYKRIK